MILFAALRGTVRSCPSIYGLKLYAHVYTVRGGRVICATADVPGSPNLARKFGYGVGTSSENLRFTVSVHLFNLSIIFEIREIIYVLHEFFANASGLL